MVGTVNLDGASDHAFEDEHDELAWLLGAKAPWATRHAGLCFDCRRTAESAPVVLRAREEGLGRGADWSPAPIPRGLPAACAPLGVASGSPARQIGLRAEACN